MDFNLIAKLCRDEHCIIIQLLASGYCNLQLTLLIEEIESSFMHVHI